MVCPSSSDLSLSATPPPPQSNPPKADHGPSPQLRQVIVRLPSSDRAWSPPLPTPQTPTLNPNRSCSRTLSSTKKRRALISCRSLNTSQSSSPVSRPLFPSQSTLFQHPLFRFISLSPINRIKTNFNDTTDNNNRCDPRSTFSHVPQPLLWLNFNFFDLWSGRQGRQAKQIMKEHHPERGDPCNACRTRAKSWK